MKNILVFQCPWRLWRTRLAGERYGLGTAPKVLAQVKAAFA